MRRFIMHAELESAAFHPDPGPEVARILRRLADRLEEGEQGDWNLLDVNGNSVGHAMFAGGG